MWHWALSAQIRPVEANRRPSQAMLVAAGASVALLRLAGYSYLCALRASTFDLRLPFCTGVHSIPQLKFLI